MGVSPVRSRGVKVYRGLGVPVPFSGRLLIGAGYADIDYLHMGFRPAYGFQRVWELVFDVGRLTDVSERSAELAAVRERFAGVRPGPVGGETTSDWIDRTFSLSFSYSWPQFPGTG
ncbi:hypothetical protein JCM9534A_23780 [Catenuloplanes indicus JCM 9534]